MQYHITPRGVEIPHMPDFDLAETLDCGQCFRWDPLPDGSFRGIAFQRQLHIYQDGDTFVLDGAREEDFQKYWREYFDLDFDYGAVRSQLSAWDPVMAQAARFAPGIRVLKQEPWEALCSFIISQNNNISRIKGIIARLCQCFGDPIPGGGYSFPEAERLCGLSPEDLEPLRCGFRAAYILSAAQLVAKGEINLSKIQLMPLPEAREQLMRIKGVGPKVAECALLYGMHRLDAFPLDVWMKRAMATLFPGKTPEDFGPYAGIAQQYLFHYSRMHPQLFQ